MDLSQIVAYLNDPMVKTLLLLLGGAILKKWEPFVNRAIPFALLVVSALATLLRTMFPNVPVDAATATYSASFVGSIASVWSNPIVATLVPLFLASGAQSTSKNTRQWAGFGFKLFRATR